MRTLSLIAIGGLGVGIASLSLAYAIGGRDLDAFGIAERWASSCGDSTGPRERSLAWEGGDSVELTLPGTVHWRAGEGNELIVRGAPGVAAHVELHGSRIVLTCRGRTGSVDITLPGRAFRRIGIAGSGNIVMENVSQPELTLRISGSGSMRAQGSVDRLTVNVAGSGDARLGELLAKQATVHISGSGKVEVAPKDQADVTISGSGDVKLLTRPADLRSKISGSGRITQAAER
jgi:Putative auto-transporter adhesin, head GIN domain